MNFPSDAWGTEAFSSLAHFSHTHKPYFTIVCVVSSFYSTEAEMDVLWVLVRWKEPDLLGSFGKLQRRNAL